MKKSYTIYKNDLNDFLSELSQAMTATKTFYNNKIIVIG